LAITLPLSHRAHSQIFGGPLPRIREADTVVSSIYNPIKRQVNVAIVDTYMEHIMNTLTVAAPKREDGEDGGGDGDEGDNCDDNDVSSNKRQRVR
jgi:hypothetical protein